MLSLPQHGVWDLLYLSYRDLEEIYLKIPH